MDGGGAYCFDFAYVPNPLVVPVMRSYWGIILCALTTVADAFTPPRRSRTASVGQIFGAPIMHVLSLREKLGDEIRLILASQSPRRWEILDMMGLKDRYSVQPSPLDESAQQTKLRAEKTHPTDYTRILAEEKAKAVAMALGATEVPTLVLGSDTIVDQDDCILEKPKDADDASRMLNQLSGRQHYVHTGVALYLVKGDSVKLCCSWTEAAVVQFAPLTSDDIEAYIATGEPMDKAGSYGIQGIGGQFVQNIEGDFFTVMGLPMHRTSEQLGAAITDALKA